MTLKERTQVQGEAIREVDVRVMEFEAHLMLSKYTQPQTDGERADWISTADVHRWLRYIREAIQDVREDV